MRPGLPRTADFTYDRDDREGQVQGDALMPVQMLRQILIALSFALSACDVSAAAQTSNDERNPTTVATSHSGRSRPHDLLNRMTGHWVLTGVIAGRNTVHDIEASWVLQGNYVRISETSRERDTNGRPAYEAIVYVGWTGERYVCFWFDNTEVASVPITCSARDAPDLIALEFRDQSGTLTFTNTFAYSPADDSWEWRMANIRDGRPVLFGTVTLRRADD